VLYLITVIALYLLSIFWIAVANPWLGEQLRDQQRWQREQDELRRRRREEEAAELKRKQEEEEALKRAEEVPYRVGDFLKFAFPIIRRASPALIAQQIVSVQPMTGPVGGIAFYRPRYGETEELRTVLDDIVDALNESDDDPIDYIVDQIMRDVFGGCPYSTYYQPTVEELKAELAEAYPEPALV